MYIVLWMKLMCNPLKPQKKIDKHEREISQKTNIFSLEKAYFFLKIWFDRSRPRPFSPNRQKKFPLLTALVKISPLF